jgi:hypothetical protein
MRSLLERDVMYLGSTFRRDLHQHVFERWCVCVSTIIHDVPSSEENYFYFYRRKALMFHTTNKFQLNIKENFPQIVSNALEQNVVRHL